jgi:hypothetical protein
VPGPARSGTPGELRSIVGRGEGDVVLVDDARLMGVSPGYPSIDEIRALVDAAGSSAAAVAS